MKNSFKFNFKKFVLVGGNLDIVFWNLLNIIYKFLLFVFIYIERWSVVIFIYSVTLLDILNFILFWSNIVDCEKIYKNILVFLLWLICCDILFF